MGKFLVPFSIVCACGLFIGLAAGIEWGKTSCGVLAGVTLAVACFWGGINADFNSGED